MTFGRTLTGLKVSYKRLPSLRIHNITFNSALRIEGTCIAKIYSCANLFAMKRQTTGKKRENWMKLIVPRAEVEIATVLSCGQSFRWKNDGPDPSQWIGVFAHYLWIMKQTDECISYKVIGKPGLSQKDYNRILWKYFQLDVSLPHLYKKWAEMDSKFAELTVTDFRGIRMLEQDPIENTFCFICSSNNNISRISQMVEKMCRFYGEPIGELNGKTYYDFPRVENLRGPEVEKKLREEGFGYRAAFIANTATKIVEHGGFKWTESLKSLRYEDARKELQALPGIGRKVADCICLMSLGFHEVIPVDTHIHQLGKQYLPHLADIKTLTEKVYSEISDYFRSIFGEYAGWAHSVLFASTLSHLKSVDAGKSKKRSRKKPVNNSVSEIGDDSSSANLSGAEVATLEVDFKSTEQSNNMNQQANDTDTSVQVQINEAYTGESNNKKQKL